MKFNLHKPKLGRKVKVKKRIDNEGMEQESSQNQRQTGHIKIYHVQQKLSLKLSQVNDSIKLTHQNK